MKQRDIGRLADMLAGHKNYGRLLVGQDDWEQDVIMNLVLEHFNVTEHHFKDSIGSEVVKITLVPKTMRIAYD